jgi:flavin reductase (DIM6/NTAB) family NADH-FMN oxidoreductase RutF
MSRVDERALRVGFNRLAVAVSIVTTLDGDRPHGCTGMAWAENPDPPLVLTTLRKDGNTLDLVRAAGVFGINVLAGDQEPRVYAFAARSREPGDRFADIPWKPGPARGVPLLDGCVASFECELRDVHPFGGHHIVVGEVVSTGPAVDERALVHYDGRLWTLRGESS